MLKPGDVILTAVQFTDSYQVKKRPAMILFESHGNYLVAGITSNTDMDGIKITKDDGAIKDSVIKTNYLFTISEKMAQKKLFHLNNKICFDVYNDLSEKIAQLKMFNNEQ